MYISREVILMSKIYYTGDLHFGHKNVLKFDNRPFETVEEMEKIIMDSWNSRVTDDDDIYILGDFAYRNEKSVDWYLKRLKGKKHLIIGNHDGEIRNSETALACFESVDKMLYINESGNKICLCHYPIAEWNGFHKGSWHIYGHIHNNKNDTYLFMKTRERALNAGCMINNYIPVTFNELVENNKLFKEQP
jgi:calcineurin-like phosphoesterase family protein